MEVVAIWLVRYRGLDPFGRAYLAEWARPMVTGRSIGFTGASGFTGTTQVGDSGRLSSGCAPQPFVWTVAA